MKKIFHATLTYVTSLDTLAKLHGNGDTQHPKVLAEYKEILDQIQFEKENVVSSYRALVEPKMFKRVILGMSIQMWSQLCGMNSKFNVYNTKCS